MKLSSRKELLKEASTMLESLRESKKKKSLNESVDFSIIGRINGWDLKDLGNFSSFDLSKPYHWKRIMGKSPTTLSEEELKQAILDSENNIQYANKLMMLAKLVKKQLQNFSSSASSISAGEKSLEGKQITAQHIADFLESIFITDTANLKKIFDMYNASVKKNYKATSKLLLKKPSDLNGIPRVRQGGKDIVFLYSRADGEGLSEDALNDSIFELLRKNYPEVSPLLTIRNKMSTSGRGQIVGVKKNYTISVLKTTISSKPALNKNWKRIFAKYADWLED
jgi:hypothetical protein